MQRDLAAEQEEMDWVEAEAYGTNMTTELQRLKRRAKKRPFFMLLITLLAVSFVLWKVSKRVPMYEGAVLMRATEGVLVDEESPMVQQGLAHYLYNVALNKKKLGPIVQEFDLYPKERKLFGDLYAIDKLRDFLDIQISGNYFAKVRDVGDVSRTVGITVVFSDFDPQIAFDVAEALSKVLVESEHQRRNKMATKLNAIADFTVQSVTERLTRQKKELAQAYKVINGPKQSKAQLLSISKSLIKSERLVRDIAATQLLLEQVIYEQANTEMAMNAEGVNQALRFEVIDVRPPLILPKTSWITYTLIGMFTFLILLPIAAITIAAFDSRLHHIEDILRLGVPVVGHIPSFSSDHVGSMQERSRRTKDIA